MATKEIIVLRNIRGSELPNALATQAGIHADQLINLTIEPLSEPPARASDKEIQQLLDEIHSLVDPALLLTDDDLYDEHGLPK